MKTFWQNFRHFKFLSDSVGSFYPPPHRISEACMICFLFRYNSEESLEDNQSTSSSTEGRQSEFQKKVLIIYYYFTVRLFISFIELILDGNLEIGAHVRSNLCYLICLTQSKKRKDLFVRNMFWVTILYKNYDKQYNISPRVIKIQDLNQFKIFVWNAIS